MRPPSLHSNFFSSLKQVDKRLKLEHQEEEKSPQKNIPFNEQNRLTASLSSPLCLFTATNDHTASSIHHQESSEPPLEFLSSSCAPSSPPTLQPHKSTLNHGGDDIELLMQLLGLSEQRTSNNQERVFEKCECDSGFYEKIVGVKGPKCSKEANRMEGWINYYMEETEKIEPFRLALLLIGNAAFVSGGGDCGFGGLEFPCTIDEFLKIDPPKD